MLLVDGVRDERHNISTSAPNTNLANVESIEVLKGPASVLFGHSALGGIINIVRKRPTAGFKADFSASSGSFNTRRIRAGAGSSIGEKLRYRVDFGMSHTHGYRHSGSNSNNSYMAFEYTPTNKDQFYLSIGANKDIYDTDAGIPVLEGSKIAPGMNVNTRYNDPQDFLKHTRYDFQLTYTRKLANNLKLANQLSYYDNNINYFGVYRRIGSAESKGFELEVNGNLLPGLDVTAGYTFSKAEILPYSSSEATNALAGKIVAFAPENLLNAWVNYEVQHGAIKGLSLSAGANYMDKTFTNSSHSYVLPAYAVFNTALGYRITRNFLLTVRHSL